MYKVEIMAAPLPRPLTLAQHLWFVISDDECASRYEVIAPLYAKSDNLVLINYFPLYTGFCRSFFDDIFHPRVRSKAVLLYTITGSNNSTAHKLFQQIVASPDTYPANKRYRLWPGPNSNTYVAWILQQVPEINFQLPFCAFGARFTLD
jgi:hypothetical protein